jgi:hypothetical protein
MAKVMTVTAAVTAPAETAAGVQTAHPVMAVAGLSHHDHPKAAEVAAAPTQYGPQMEIEASAAQTVSDLPMGIEAFAARM